MDLISKIAPFIFDLKKHIKKDEMLFSHQTTRIMETSATSSINKMFFVFAGYMKMSYYVTQTMKDRRRCRGQGRFACDNCDRRYHQMKNLRRHVTNECGKQPMHQCSFCPYRATYKSYLQVHMMKHAKHGFVPRMATLSKHRDS